MNLRLFTSALPQMRPLQKRDPWQLYAALRLPVISTLPESDPVRYNYATDEGTRLVVFPFTN